MQILKSHQTLEFTKQYLPENPTIIEAGAFCGNDSKKMSLLWPHGTIHSFEPVPQNFAKLVETTQTLPNVHRYPIALSSTQGTATLHLSHNPKKPTAPSPASSLHQPQERLNWSPIAYEKSIEVPTTTLDAWAQEHNIKQIDFLWLDMQGHELAVMQAAPNTMAQAQVIVCEVQFVRAYEQCPLADEVQAWVEAQGFEVVAKDFTTTTDWFFGNLVFVRK